MKREAEDTKFFGIDLAWKIEAHPRTARCAVSVFDEDLRLLGNAIFKTDVEIANYVLNWTGNDNALIAIDAPLSVPEDVQTCRECEAVLGRLDLPAYPANRNRFFNDFGGVRGEVLKELFIRTIPSARYVDSLEPMSRNSAIMEIYPYAALKVLHWERQNCGQIHSIDLFKGMFNRIRVPKYKGAGINKTQRLSGLMENILLIKEVIPSPGNIFRGSRELRNEDFNILDPIMDEQMTVNQLEQVADYLDSLVAGYTIWRYWRFGDERSLVIGNVEDGCILIPADQNISVRYSFLD